MTALLRTHPLDVERVRERTDRVLSAFVADRGARFIDVVPTGQALIESVTTFLDGGKRLRPAFCYWGWRGAGGADDDRIIPAGAALELLHTFALIHDDIIDRSDQRRGAPSVHRQHSDFHVRAGMHGNAEDYGTAIALLLGDLCLGWFHDLLDECDLPAGRRQAARRLMSTAFTELIAGQCLDVAEQGARGLSVERAARIIRYKTAKYTIERPLHLGAVLAGADAELLRVYSRYALPLGEAFQLRDDLLGAFGEPDITGKSDADDIRTGKPTMLLALTLDRATPAHRTEILRLLDAEDLAEPGIERIRTLMIDTGAAAAIEHRITAGADAAHQALTELRLQAPADETLRALIDTVAYRAH
ncbi:polyprenyl synthetase family protein [Pseudonocardia spinosispora]|uniref:polyprenyl synthetase family protein n=1 Tax=Pseudonocardia spinosispora TaxID=103441 RepID=UPI000408BE91|nr:polyprenyl synthetase family protein [Pseudonocardia spinosispora]